MLDKTPLSVAAPISELRRTVRPLSALSSWWVLAALGPLFLTILVIGMGYSVAGGTDPGFPPEFPTLVYGAANVAVVVLAYSRMNQDVWRATALFRWPSSREVAAGACATVGGVAVGWPLTTLIADAVGVARYTVPSVSSLTGVGSLFFGAVVVAPIAEELLFRGLFLGIVLNRGYGPAVAGASSLSVFAAMHVFTAGTGGVVNALLLGALLTWLRLRFDSLTGAWLMHLLNNLLELLIVLSIVPSFYAL